MSSHSNRSAYLVCHEGILQEPNLLQCPFSKSNVTESSESVDSQRPQEPRFMFGRMFPEFRTKIVGEKPDERVIAELLLLAQKMKETADEIGTDSDVPAGYTYLGQFIAHEITFDKTEEPLNGASPGYRSPQIDLDSLYGRGPVGEHRRFYQDSARLKVGETIAGPSLRKTFYNDLPRVGFGGEKIGQALIADPRNDENLAIAQTHLAFIKFHNKLVDAAYFAGAKDLFETAKKEVIQHFQWIILKDFLPKLLYRKGEELECLRTGKPTVFEPDKEYGVVMPLEFSVAAFRFGHSMVRKHYEWNHFQQSKYKRVAKLENLFRFTRFSGDLNDKPRLESEWIVDWRRFFDFPSTSYPDKRPFNKARRIDSHFSLRIEDIKGYPHVTKNPTHQPIVARNLLRGYACGLPTGEDVARFIKVKPLMEKQIDIDTPLLKGRTPLWYYILKEAEHNDGQLGPVASFIIAETLVGLIKASPYSILSEENRDKWKPKYGPRVNFDENVFEMTDLLNFAEVVDPIGEHMGRRL
jgi:Animal haem peroxidase